MIRTAIPPSYGMSISDQAIIEAQNNQSTTLLIEGYIEGECGLPAILKAYAAHMTLRIYSSYDAPVSLGVYLLHEENVIENIIAQLEDHGGYRYVLYEKTGSVIAQN